MKQKQLVIIVIAVAIFLTCGILAVSTIRKSTRGSEKLQFLSMKLETLESEVDLREANGCALKALYAIADISQYEKYNNKAIELLIGVEENMKNVIASPNIFDEEIQALRKQFERAGEILQKGSNKSEKELQEFFSIQKDAAVKHIYLIKCSAAFSTLYSIREFDSLPEDEAKEKLQEYWYEFRFDESIKCPETIDKVELYKLWARQYFIKELDQSMLERIHLLRADDKLTSKEHNAKWLELIEELYWYRAGYQPLFLYLL